jgi:hypothetical protein
MREPDDEHDQNADPDASGAMYAVGYKRPPRHTRFQPGVSGNPSGRRKGSKNIRTIVEQILGEEISLRDGGVTKKITKAEAIVRALVHGAIKGESSSQQNLFRLAQQIGQFEEAPANLQRIERVIVQWKSSDDDQVNSPALPANSQVNSE